MNIALHGTKITQDSKILAFEGDNGVSKIVVTVDTDTTWTYKLDVDYANENSRAGENYYNIIQLNRSDDVCLVTFTMDMLPFDGRYSMQLRALNEDGRIYHSDIFNVWVKRSINPYEAYNPVPSEFLEIEKNITDINNHPPYPGDNGYWMIWNTVDGEYKESNIEVPVYTGTVDIDSVVGGDSTNFTPGTSNKVLTAHIEMRSDTEANWAANDPLLATGEMGLTTDGTNKGKFKIGDGVNSWSALKYYGVDGVSGDYVTVKMLENGEVSLPVASATKPGGIVSSNEVNNIYVNPTTGVATIDTLSISKLTQEDNTILVLDGGDADILTV